MNTGRFPRTADYLGHIAEAIARIQCYTAGMTAEQFLANEEKQDAVVRNFEVIGEAAQNIRRTDPQFVAAHPEFPWSGAYAMRNAVAHGYFSVDLGVDWRTIQLDLPDLARQVAALRSESA